MHCRPTEGVGKTFVAPLIFFCACWLRVGIHLLCRDVEHHNVHSYAGVTCLLQLSTGAHYQLLPAATWLLACVPASQLTAVLAPARPF